MRKSILALTLGLWTAVALPAASPPTAPAKGAKSAVPPALPDSQQIEKDLQRLPWPQFRSVIEAIPKLKADVDAYGPFGWQYVKANYQTHGWKKNVDRLDDAQKRQLVELIRSAKGVK